MVSAARFVAKSFVLTMLGLAAGGGLWIARTSAFAPLAPQSAAPARVFDLNLKIDAMAPPLSLDELAARPLFSPERKPRVLAVFSPPTEPAPVASVIPEMPVAAPSYVVSGVLISASLRKALLQNNINEKGLWVSEGSETREGWRVLTVSPDTITILRNSQLISLDVRRFKRALVSE